MVFILIYIIIESILLVIIIVFYTLIKLNGKDENNLLEDVPIISVSTDSLEKHAEEISSYFSDTKKTNSKRTLIRSLDKGYIELVKGYNFISEEVRNKKEVVPASEWLLDNLYLIEKEYKDIKHNMPISYYKNLPVIGKGILKGYPRVYYLAVELVSHTDGRIEGKTIEKFIKAYQKNSILTIGELWILPIMIRIALIQNIGKTTEKIIQSEEDKKRADNIAEKLVYAFNDDSFDFELNKLYEIKSEFTPHFVERLLKSLRENGIESREVYDWIDVKTQELDSNPEKMINMEHQLQANFQLSIGNSVNSMREVESLNWKEEFEKLSQIEEILAEDPSGIYLKMDFETKDYYRHVIEKIARKFKTSEAFVAKKTIECCSSNDSIEEDEDFIYKECKNHVGYYLIDEGIYILKKKLLKKNHLLRKIHRISFKARINLYIFSIIFLTVGIDFFVTYKFIYTKESKFSFFLAFAAVLIPISEIIITTINWSINHLVKPRIIPKLEFNDGVPEEARTLVVIPTLLNNVERVHELISDLEVYYLGNMEKNLYFILLGDFKDGKNREETEDKDIIKAGLFDVEALNKKYSADGENIFYFLNRIRQYNPKEKLWMGYERKRGKLMEFNSLLRGDKTTSYNVISGSLKDISKAKYIITLDADTKLPRDSGKRLIGAMEHILNRPVIDINTKKVRRGYSIMQPRVSVGTISANKTLFTKIFSGETGIDMYTSAISDVYQDAFGEGIFTGKGIYNIDAFRQIIKDEIPENAVLSHDLLEGSYLRCALITDVELIDGYPAYYNSSSMRLHRWVRGDWQLLPWLIRKTPLNRLSKWKIFDNLRRSVLSLSIVLLIILGISGFNGKVESLFVIAILALLCPILFDVSETVVSPVRGISLTGKINSFSIAVEQFFLLFACLTYQAYLMLDAIVRTIYRLVISKENLLEWQTADDTEKKSGRKLKNYISEMWTGSVIGLLICIFSFYKSFDLGIFMFPTCTLWILSPLIGYRISREKKKNINSLSFEQISVLRRISRETWAYFQDFINSETNWLAPDNFQEDPKNGLAYRTSPTNLGMGLISNIVAYDMGYIGMIELLDRIENITRSMESLKRYNGHFYNWYDILTKDTLKPEYISTVDSGNLVGYLWVVVQSLSDYTNIPIIDEKQKLGICDTLALATEEISLAGGEKQCYSDIMTELKNKEMDVISWKTLLLKVWSKAIEVEKNNYKVKLYWNCKIKRDVSNYLLEIQRLFPWTDLLISGQDKIEEILDKLKAMPLKKTLSNFEEELDNASKALSIVDDNAEINIGFVNDLTQMINSGKMELNQEFLRINKLIDRLNDLASTTNFSIVYDKNKQLFSIGYDFEKGEIVNCYYDLLASEARQASFVAIAKGDIEQKHWFKLGRAMTIMDKSKGLISWSGTMFEYFMPLLIMKNYPDTLLDETYNAVIKRQKSYCKYKKVPWGISEAAFFGFDINKNYQYKAFGVPGTGLKRGLNSELVISPYSTLLALSLSISEAYPNIKKLISEGLEGRYGFYESVDYTKDRIAKSKKKSIVRCFMVHHQGMSLMALNNVLNENVLQERFHKVPQVKATELLLQEKIPNRVIYDREEQFEVVDASNEKRNSIVRRYNTAITRFPETHILSNGSYSVMISITGSGYGKFEGINAYRWKEDMTLDCSGMFFYVKNINSNEYWSATYQPCREEGEDYEVAFSLDKAEFKRKDGNIVTHTEITVSNEDNAEVRKLSITNHSLHNRVVEVTSYCEVTLARQNADMVHPAFSNLFIKTDYDDFSGAILANRRGRSSKEEDEWMMQVMAVKGESVGNLEYETSRMNFIGRNRDLSKPKVLENNTPLSNSIGAVVDPIISLRRRVKIKSGQTVIIAYTTAVGKSKEEMIEVALKYREIDSINRAFELAWTQSQVGMKYLGIKSSQANLYQIMGSRLLFLNSQLREREEYIRKISMGQSSLWPYGISGDFPITLLLIKEEGDLALLKQMLKAHEYLSTKGLKTDLVVINLMDSAYLQQLNDKAKEIISSGYGRDKDGKICEVFLFNKSTMDKKTIDFLIAISRLVIDGEKGSLFSQIRKCEEDECDISEGGISEKKNVITSASNFKKESTRNIENRNIKNIGQEYVKDELDYFNGLGGFDKNTCEYSIILEDRRHTPAPWINIISNKNFGFHVSESGTAYTWYKNSRENKLTTWSNDPVQDLPSEGLYIKEKEEVWSISPAPIRDDGRYFIKHGFGYSSFRHSYSEVEAEMTMFVPIDSSLKIIMINIKNLKEKVRNINLYYFAEIVLGVLPQQSAQYIYTDISTNEDLIYAENPYNEKFNNQRVFLKIIGEGNVSYTGDRTEFLGREGSYTEPSGLKENKFSGRSGGGLDPCLAGCINLNIDSYGEKNLLILLGAEESIKDMESTVRIYSSIEKARKALENIKAYWGNILGSIQVKTPDKSLDIMMNKWLLYQTISCRLWARTAFYQSGGAYGFRDQLQDVMAVEYVKPEFTRAQIILCASKQYVEGDVQHWWHPVVESGIRTKFSDDLLWLPYVTSDYINATGDFDLLNEKVEYIIDEPLKEGEDERYKIVTEKGDIGDVYQHCIRAIEKSLKFGAHKLPLMGSGDWNDGMNTIGNKGKGESVWLAWFLYKVLDNFIPVCYKRNDEDKAKKYMEVKELLKQNIENNAWDGSWYRRAYFDDGKPLGSIENDECRIDSISQSWSVISGAALPSRAKEAMDSLEKHLLKEENGLILLLDPPFDKSKLEPGYIKGYIPGVRENGGQYTHAAIWAILAEAKMGDGKKAWRYFNMINPINHTQSHLDCERYKVEPYVMTADVYAVSPHVGRGGWSWYTGAAGWMYKVGLESILGLFIIEGKGFTLKPCVPEEWNSYQISYKKDNSCYDISIVRGNEYSISLDGVKLEDNVVPYKEKGNHKVSVTFK